MNDCPTTPYFTLKVGREGGSGRTDSYVGSLLRERAPWEGDSEAAGVVSTARIERAASIYMIPPSSLAFLPWDCTHVGLRAAVERGPSGSSTLLNRGQANRPSLCASSDFRFIVGALRTRRMVACSLAPFRACAFREQEGDQAAHPIIPSLLVSLPSECHPCWFYCARRGSTALN